MNVGDYLHLVHVIIVRRATRNSPECSSCGTAFVLMRSELVVAIPEFSGSIPTATRFSEY
jgi:hypothetical protein